MDEGFVINNKYRVESRLGSGSFSDVFLVTAPSDDPDHPNKKTALKLLKKGLGGETNPGAVADFKNEFSILRDLNHPHIARILDFGYDAALKQYYYTGDLLHGANVFEATAGKGVDFILELFVQALRAFQYLHAFRVYHFDVKAANLLVLKPDDTLKVIDFGLASIDPKGRLIGTPSYMAPEIIAKERPDGRADLYSLGVLFYYCFARVNPFRGKGVQETIHNQQVVVAPAASEFRKDVPPFLDRILARLLEKNPANRYSQAAEVLRDINFDSPKKFALETKETLLSYLPEEGRFVGRKEEREIFEKNFGKSFFLLLEGDSGTGKTRLLREFKYQTQIRGVPSIFLLDDLDDLDESSDETQSFRGLLARHLFLQAGEEDDHPPSAPLSFVVTCSKEEKIPASLRELFPKKLVKKVLGPFSSQELKDYVVSLTGLQDPPESLLSGLMARTEGNPLLVTELLRSLIQQGALFDPAGRWKRTTFDDIGVDFSKVQLNRVLQDLLLQRFRALEPSPQKIMKVLAVAETPLKIRQIELVLERGFIPSLEALMIQGLVAHDEQDRSYFIRNETLADLIRQQLPLDERRILHDQLATIFEGKSERRIFHEIRGSDLKRALALALETAARHLREARGREAAELYQFAAALECPRTVEEEIEICLKLGESWLIALRYEEALKSLHKAEEILAGLERKEEKIHSQVDALLRLGGVYYKLGELEKSRAALDQALGLLKFLKGDRVREQVAQNLQGAILLQEGRWDEARGLFERTRKTWETEFSPSERARVTNNELGTVYLMSKQYPQAHRQFSSDLQFHESVGDDLLIARTHYNLGQACDGLKEFEKAAGHYQKCAVIAQRLKNMELLLRAYNGLGNAYNLWGKPTEAILHYERGLDLSERTGDLRSHAAILVNIGIIESSQGQEGRAKKSLAPAVSLLKSFKARLAFDWQILARALLEEGEIARKEKKWQGAEKILKEALRISEEQEGAKAFKFWILRALGELYLERGQNEEASQIFPEIKENAQTPDEIEQVSALEESMSKSMTNVPGQAGGPNPYAHILEINKFINAESDLPFVLKTVLSYALELSQAEAGLILLLNERGQLEVKASRNIASKDEISEVSQTIARKAIDKGEWIRSEDAREDPRFNTEASIMRLELKSVLCFPIKSKRKTIGVIYLDNRLLPNAFEHVDVEVLKAFAEQVGIAIENARLLEGYEEKSRALENKVGEISSQLEQYQSLAHISQKGIETKYDYGNIVSRSRPMQEIFRLLDKITDTDLSVFVHGESGTGKELVARALHFNSARSKKRFVAVNCGAIPANLIESELFGYKAGAFTGATRDKKGLFEEADGGTIFLDEVGEIEMALQAKLLRVAQEGEFYRVGESQSMRADVRIISASNKDIQIMVKENKFREDLYYRLCQIRIDLPPLRERREDIPLLVAHFVREESKKGLKVSSHLMKAFLEYDWPGNIRELENLVKVAVALSEGGVIDARSIPGNYGIAKFLKQRQTARHAKQPQRGVEGATRAPMIDDKNKYDPKKSWYDYEKLIIAKALQVCEFNVRETALKLGLAVATLYKKIKEIGIASDGSDHPLYREAFHYDPSKKLKDYLKPVFQAALKYANNKPYTAIANLKVSQGYFYKVMKGGT